MCEFKIGDRVENIYTELQGKIIDISDDKLRNILVEYDEPIPAGHDGHGANVKGNDGHCWWESEEVLELVETQKTYTQEEVDDILEALEHNKVIKTRYAEAIADFNDDLTEKEEVIQDLNKKLDNMDLVIDKKDNIIRNLSEMLIDLTNEDV